jgi:hypothetical protein
MCMPTTVSSCSVQVRKLYYNDHPVLEEEDVEVVSRSYFHNSGACARNWASINRHELICWGIGLSVMFLMWAISQIDWVLLGVAPAMHDALSGFRK